MNIAELFVSVSASTGDVDSKMRGVSRSLSLVENASKGATLHTGRLGNQFANLAGRIAHVHPIVGNLANVLGDFAIGGLVTAGVLGGLAAVAVAFDKLTSASRKAMEAGDKLAESYNKAARISALGLGGQQKADIEDINKGLEQHSKWLGFIIAARVQLGALGGLFGNDPGGHSAAIAAGTTAKAAAEQQRVNALGLQNAKDNEAWANRIKDANEKAAAAAKKAQQDFLSGISSSLAVFDNLAAHGTASSVVNQKLIDDYKRIAEQIREMGNASTPAALELLKLRDALAANLVVSQAIAAANRTGTVGPLAGKTLPGVGFTPGGLPLPTPMSTVGSPSEPIVKVESAIERQTREAEEHARLLADTISNTASQIGSIVASAIGTFGSSRGNAIGGALGGAFGAGVGGYFGKMAGTAVGGYFGSAVGSVIPVVGTIVGGFIGSAIGGLFGSHKKEVSANTQALRANTAVLNQILNAPQGFKVAAYRYDATDIKDVGLAVRRYRARGGANPLLPGR